VRLDPDTVPLSRVLIDAICHDHPFAIPWPQLRGRSRKLGYRAVMGAFGAGEGALAFAVDI
jgi:hypothetical protein